MDALEFDRRTAALMEDCLRVDAEGVELGVTDPNDPLYRDGQRVIRQTLREALRGQAHWLKARAPIIHVPVQREPVTRPRERRATTRRSAASRGDPDPEPAPPLRVVSPAAFRREVRRELGGAA
jgi:hypothetical protein